MAFWTGATSDRREISWKDHPNLFPATRAKNTLQSEVNSTQFGRFVEEKTNDRKVRKM